MWNEMIFNVWSIFFRIFSLEKKYLFNIPHSMTEILCSTLFINKVISLSLYTPYKWSCQSYWTQSSNLCCYIFVSFRSSRKTKHTKFNFRKSQKLSLYWNWPWRTSWILWWWIHYSRLQHLARSYCCISCHCSS